MAAQPPPNDGALATGEISKLTRFGAIALATRCAMRVAPLYHPYEKQSSEQAITGYLAIDICTLVAVGVASGINVPTEIVRTAAYANPYTNDSAKAAYAAAYAAYATAKTYAYAADAHVYTAKAYGYITKSHDNSSNTAAKADYDTLIEHNLGEPDSKGNPVPQDFFARPLWPDQEGLMPPDWQRVVEKWQQRLVKLDLSHIYDRHMRMLYGEGLDWERAQNDLDEWMRQYAHEAADTSEEARPPTPETPSPEPPGSAKSAPETASPENLVTEPEKGLDAAVADLLGVPPDALGVPPIDTDRITTAPPLPSAPGFIGNPTSHADQLADQDLLGRQNLVDVLAAMIASPKQNKPFTLALLGDWGIGKSSVMKLLQDKLNETQRYKGRFDFAWFNAWEYEHTDNMAAGLAQEVVGGLVQHVQPWHRVLRRNGLFLRFACHRHGREFVKKVMALLAVVIALPALPVILLVLGDPNSDWFKWLNEYQIPAIGTGGAIAGVFLVTLGKNFLAGFKEILQHPLSAQLKTYLNVPTYKEHLGHIPVIKQDLKALCDIQLGGDEKKPRRLVVFVDDLDRCGPQCISKTLDAIRLVMNLDNVVVIIGIDHRIALRAIGEQFKDLADNHRSKEDIARDYLGKIIQLPIRLTPSQGEDLKQFVHRKLFLDATKTKHQTPRADQPSTAHTPTKPAGDDAAAAPNIPQRQSDIPFAEPLKPSRGHTQRDPDPAPVGLDEADTPDLHADANNAPTTANEPELDLEREMQDTHGERDLFHKLANQFDFANPRQLARLRNSYRLLKTLDKLQRKQATPTTGEPVERWQWLMQMVFWQEFLYQWPRPVRNACVDALENDRSIPLAIPLPVRKVFDSVAEPIRATFSIDRKNTEVYEQAARFVQTLILPRGDEAQRPKPDQDQSNNPNDAAKDT